MFIMTLSNLNVSQLESIVQLECQLLYYDPSDFPQNVSVIDLLPFLFVLILIILFIGC